MSGRRATGPVRPGPNHMRRARPGCASALISGDSAAV